VNGRWHDARHTLITELAESGAGDQTIVDILGHVSRQMLARYSHIPSALGKNDPGSAFKNDPGRQEPS